MVDQELVPQYATVNFSIIRVPEFRPHALTCCFNNLKAQCILIEFQDLRYAIQAQWLTKDIAIRVSDALLGPSFETPYDGLT